MLDSEQIELGEKAFEGEVHAKEGASTTSARRPVATLPIVHGASGRPWRRRRRR